jgi:hypothetical protein
VVRFLCWSVAGLAVGGLLVTYWVHATANRDDRRKTVRAAGYWHFGAWVVGRGAARGDLVGLPATELA